jgi:Subtilase family
MTAAGLVIHSSIRLYLYLLAHTLRTLTKGNPSMWASSRAIERARAGIVFASILAILIARAHAVTPSECESQLDKFSAEARPLLEPFLFPRLRALESHGIVSETFKSELGTDTECTSPRVVRVAFVSDATARAAADGVSAFQPVVAGSLLFLRSLDGDAPSVGDSALEKATALCTLAANVASVEFELVSRFELHSSFKKRDPVQKNNTQLLRAIKLSADYVPSHDPKLTLAIIDTGVRPSHPDLPDNLIWVEASLRSPDGKCSTAPCCEIVDGAHAYYRTHGTQVAGLASAVRRNGVGIAGIGNVARVLSIRVEDQNGCIDSSNVAAAIHCALDLGADVVNMSIGVPRLDDDLRVALDRVAGANVILVASSGNAGGPSDALPLWPAEYNSSQNITVEARGYDGGGAASTVRTGYTDIAAPAPEQNSVCSTTVRYGRERWHCPSTCTANYADFSRSSAAAAIVSGAATLVWSDPRFSRCSAADVVRLLLSRAHTACGDQSGMEPGVTPGVCMLDLSFLTPTSQSSQPTTMPACMADQLDAIQ